MDRNSRARLTANASLGTPITCATRADAGRLAAVACAPQPLRVDAIRKLAQEVTDAGSTLVLSDDTLSAARHAAEHGWIDEMELEEVAAEGRAETRRSDPTSPTVIVEETNPS